MTERQREIVLGYAECSMNAVETGRMGGYLRIRTPVWHGPRRRRGKRGKHDKSAKKRITVKISGSDPGS